MISRLLLLGNSYTLANDLEQVTAALLAEIQGEAPAAQRLAAGGLTFLDHVARAQGADAQWQEALSPGGESWDWVVLQEQSQIPGFGKENADYAASLAAAGTLDGYAQGRSAQTLFLMTWGREEGDSTNPSLYPDFSTMQGLLAEGYLRYAQSLSTAERPVWVAPAGLAFAHVHDAIAAEGGDPLAEGSLFDALYLDDGSHPSPAGTYLVACVIAASLTGTSPVGLAADPLGLDPSVRAALQEAAEAVVIGNAAGLAYPWHAAEDPGDSASPAEDPGDSAADDEEADDADPASPPPAARSCGCQGSAAALAPLVLLGLRRARARPGAR